MTRVRELVGVENAPPWVPDTERLTVGGERSFRMTFDSSISPERPQHDETARYPVLAIGGSGGCTRSHDLERNRPRSRAVPGRCWACRERVMMEWLDRTPSSAFGW